MTGWVASPTTATITGDALVRRCEQCGGLLRAAEPRCAGCGAEAVSRSPFLELTDPAAPLRRAWASVVDAAVPVAVLATQIVLREPGSAVRWSLWAVLLVWVLVLAVTEGLTGRTPGKHATGLRTVDARDGRPIGVLRGAVRTMVKIVVGLGTLLIAGLSYRWDPHGREMTWWDRVADSRVIPASVVLPGGSVRGTTAPVGRDDGAPWAPGPQPPVTRVPGVPPRAPAASRPDGPPPGTRPVGPSAARPPRVPAPPVRSSAPATVRPPEPPPAAPPVPTADRRARHAAPETAPPPVVEPGEGWGRAEMRDGPPGVVAEPTAETIARTRVTPTAAADPTRVHSRHELGTPARVPGRATTAVVQWDTDVRVVVGGSVLIGRDPVADDGEKIDRLLAVGKDSVGVSKTHLLLSITTSGVTVTDRHSTNGVRLEHPDGSAHLCEPGVALPVQDGDVIRFGGRSLTLPTD